MSLAPALTAVVALPQVQLLALAAQPQLQTAQPQPQPQLLALAAQPQQTQTVAAHVQDALAT